MLPMWHVYNHDPRIFHAIPQIRPNPMTSQCTRPLQGKHMDILTRPRHPLLPSHPNQQCPPIITSPCPRTNADPLAPLTHSAPPLPAQNTTSTPPSPHRRLRNLDIRPPFPSLPFPFPFLLPPPPFQNAPPPPPQTPTTKPTLALTARDDQS